MLSTSPPSPFSVLTGALLLCSNAYASDAHDGPRNHENPGKEALNGKSGIIISPELKPANLNIHQDKLSSANLENTKQYATSNANIASNESMITDTKNFEHNNDSETESLQQNKKIERTEKLRMQRKRIQDENRAKLKEFRAKTLSKPPPEGKKSTQSSKLRNMRPEHKTLKIMSREDIERVTAFNRELGWGGWGGNSVNTDAYDISNVLADPSGEYDEWQQAYRTLGVFVDCDHDWGNSGSGDNNGDRGCSRWMMWAAYIDPNYQGGGYAEYHTERDDDGNDQTDDANQYGSLDCHLDSTEWMLLGVYRQEFYQYLEQISKHLWAADEWEYVVALAALEYIGEEECEAVGYDNNAAPLYAAVQPLQLGYFQMGLYSDENCLYAYDLDELGYTYDDFWDGGDRRLANDDGGGGDDDYYWWKSAQEYTLADANEVYDTFKYCTLCIDYPTYQDGEINGDSGYDDDDLINQCWKFYSHDSFTCGAECIRTGHAQGGITNLRYGNNYFGIAFTDEESSSSSSSESSSSKSSRGSAEGASKFLFTREKLDRLKANVFVTFAGILFIATFLAFSVARSSRGLPKGAMSAKHRRRMRGAKTAELLTDDERHRHRRRRRSKGRRKSSSSSRYEPPKGDSSPKRIRRKREKDPVSSPGSLESDEGEVGNGNDKYQEDES